MLLKVLQGKRSAKTNVFLKTMGPILSVRIGSVFRLHKPRTCKLQLILLHRGKREITDFVKFVMTDLIDTSIIIYQHLAPFTVAYMFNISLKSQPSLSQHFLWDKRTIVLTSSSCFQPLECLVCPHDSISSVFKE